MILIRKILLIFSSFLLVVFVACEEEPIEEQVIRPVRYMEVIEGGGGQARIYTGVAKAGIESKLSFKVNGNIRKIKVKVGSKVKRGHIIALLDASDYQVKVKEAEAGLKQAESLELNAKNNYERSKSLYETNSISKSELDAARANYESARANVDGVRSSLQLAKLQLSYTRLLAPFDGIIADVPVDLNENVKAGDHIATITSEGETEVEISVPGVMISHITVGTKVEVSFAAVKDEVFSGKVTEVGISTVGIGTTYPVKVKLDNIENRIRPGMAAEVKFQIEKSTLSGLIIVAPNCVGEDSDGNYVFILIPDSGNVVKAYKQMVLVGNLTGDGLEIIEGLVGGELIVTAGVSRVQNGQKVKLLINQETIK
jgi:RND family efflux transporter MFP subunit